MMNKTAETKLTAAQARRMVRILYERPAKNMSARSLRTAMKAHKALKAALAAASEVAS